MTLSVRDISPAIECQAEREGQRAASRAPPSTASGSTRRTKASEHPVRRRWPDGGGAEPPPPLARCPVGRTAQGHAPCWAIPEAPAAVLRFAKYLAIGGGDRDTSCQSARAGSARRGDVGTVR